MGMALGIHRSDDARGLPITEGTSHRVVADGDVPLYVAGDCRTGSSLVVNAIADGLACADEVAKELGR